MRCISVWTTPYLRRPEAPSPPYRGSSSATHTEIAPIEEGDSRDHVENK